MERRDKTRRAHRSEIGFWELGSDKRHIGYSTNISSTGLYLTTNYLLPRGTRLRVEISLGGRSNILEAQVARMVRSLNNLRPPGMGLRFLMPEEVVAEVTTELGARASAVAPAPPQVGPSVPAPPSSVSAQAPSVSGPPVVQAQALASPTAYPRVFVDRAQFQQAYQRDLRTGGLFVPTKDPAAIGSVVEIALMVAEALSAPLRFQARVVHRLENGAGPVAGMGVEILAFEQIEHVLRRLAQPADSPSDT
jgi:Tfp pilus assembly protein PilZ